MGIISTNKELSVSKIECGDSFNVKLSLTAEPEIITNPVDIVLVLDRSGSMAGSPLENLKTGVKKFIDIIDESTDGQKDGQIGNDSHIGIVSFSTNATQDTALITSVDDLNSAVDALVSGGSTNHADAFEKATQLLENSVHSKVMVMFTDGITTVGDLPAPFAETARAKGITIYCIGLTGSTGIDPNTLNDWASDPDSEHVAITPDESELENLFANLAENISKAGAKDIVIIDTISPCFRVISVAAPSKGTAFTIDENNVKWEIDKLGAAHEEEATLEFTVEHIGNCSGMIEVNTAINYTDSEQNVVTFPSPEIEIDCGGDVFNEGCPETVDITIGGCSDTVEYDAGDLYMDSLGRILQIDVALKNICPNKRVALATIVTEVDALGNEYKRGLKTLVIPAHNGRSCRDVTVRCIKFVMPELIDESGSATELCNTRKFKARFIANYIDTDFDCCNTTK